MGELPAGLICTLPLLYTASPGLDRENGVKNGVKNGEKTARKR